VPLARVLVSSCLLGADVRYHGGSARIDNDILRRWQDEGRIVPVCPEVAGGLSTPRPPAELMGGDGVRVLLGAATVRTDQGRDVTDAFVAGARHAASLARQFDVKVAVLKSNSPSCGVGVVYDGTFSGTKIPGMGVAAAALLDAGVQVFTEQQIEQANTAIEKLDDEGKA
jgi:uncharacterized protein YbbK (DUF523 family)